MRFKAQFTDRGLRCLEKGFLPTLDKFGKQCQVLIGPTDIHFVVQTPINTDGLRVTARFARDVIFDGDNYKCVSKHYNLIAFQVDLALLLRVLRGAGTNNADTLEVKLAMRAVPPSNQSKPFLAFTGKGHSVCMEQGLPISHPFKDRDIDQLVQVKEVATLCSYYTDIAPAVPRLQMLVERMRTLGDILTMALTKGGDMHLQVGSAAASLGIQIQNLCVFPQSLVPAALVNRAATAEEQLRAAVAAGDAVPVGIQLKQLAKVLKFSHVTGPAQILCGVADNAGYVHIMFVYKDPERLDSVYDDNVSLSFQLPVRDED